MTLRMRNRIGGRLRFAVADGAGKLPCALIACRRGVNWLCHLGVRLINNQTRYSATMETQTTVTTVSTWGYLRKTGTASSGKKKLNQLDKFERASSAGTCAIRTTTPKSNKEINCAHCHIYASCPPLYVASRGTTGSYKVEMHKSAICDGLGPAGVREANGERRGGSVRGGRR